jgi:hypothetical protein
MPFTSEYDTSSLIIHLNELKSTFDKYMRDGETFANVKEIHMQIKEVECHLKAVGWDAEIHANTSTRASQLKEARVDSFN